MRYIVENRLEENLLRRNQAALATGGNTNASVHVATEKMAMQLLQDQVFALSGPRLANALLVIIAPGQPVTRQKTAAGTKLGGLKTKRPGQC